MIFFFQAEDGIRDHCVTGVQTCALPILIVANVNVRDMNGDGFPDLYVCNDYWTPDRIWINDGKGHFRAIDKLALRHTSASSMGVDFADLNRSGHMDFFVVDMLSRDHRLRKRQWLAQRTMA